MKRPPPEAKPAALSGAAAPTAAEAWWDQHYRRADSLSLSYGDRYRSSYILIILLAFATVLASALLGPLLNSLAGPDTGSVTATIIDFILLGLIGLLVWVNHSRGWHERWITYRLLAELCRKQVILAPLGRTLPGVEVNRTAMEAAAHHAITGADGHKAVVPPRESWVGWYFLALQRGAPLPRGDAAAAARRALQLARSLIHEQKLYHHDRRERAERADRNLADTGTWFFLLTLAGLGLRLFLAAEGVPLDKMAWIEILATFFSAASAGFVGLRAYTEFALLGRQSLYMGEVMEEFSNELDLIDLALPLASRDLGGVLHRLAMAMMLEVRGWAQLFRLKSVETG